MKILENIEKNHSPVVSSLIEDIRQSIRGKSDITLQEAIKNCQTYLSERGLVKTPIGWFNPTKYNEMKNKGVISVDGEYVQVRSRRVTYYANGAEKEVTEFPVDKWLN